VWVSVWDSARDAQEFQAAYNQLLSAKYRQEEPSAQIAGRWTTERGAAHVERRDTTVVVVEGVPLELADAVVARVWTGQFPSASEAVTAAPAQGPTEPSRLGASEFAGRGQALLDRFPLQMDEALLLEAVGYFKKALRVDETDLAACLGLAEALARLGTLGEGTDDPDTARYWLARATSLRPDHPDVLQVTALVAWHRGRYAEAEAAAREAIRREPASGRLYFRLGQILGDNARHNDQEQAIATLQTALALEPTPRGQWRILIELSRIYNGLGRREEELAAERRAVELEPTAWWGWHNYVDTLLHFGRHDEAIAAAQRALTLRDYAWTRSHLVEAYLRKGMAAEAKAQLELIQAAEVLAYLASVFREAREAEQALALARKAVTLDPADPYHYQQLGLAWEALGESQRAIDAFTQATCLSPRGPRDRDNVSIAYYRWAGILAFDRQRYAEALPLYQRALSANPSNAWVYYGLGTCYHQLGRFSEARQAWKRFLEFQPSGEWADRVRQKLASLDGA
jgi:tetratricopeptide (TPR) repeat protein